MSGLMAQFGQNGCPMNDGMAGAVAQVKMVWENLTQVAGIKADPVIEMHRFAYTILELSPTDLWSVQICCFPAESPRISINHGMVSEQKAAEIIAILARKDS
jgi:hypothetical protein